MTAGRILVCDDEPQILRALRVVLRDAGFEAVPAETMEQALDAAALAPPDAAIVDLVLPDGDGVELTRRLREWSQAPILAAQCRGRRGREDPRAGRRRRRLRDQAVQPARAARPPASDAAARRPRRRESRSSAPTASSSTSPPRSCVATAKTVHLTKTEFGLLRMLMVNRGRLLTHRALLTEVWGPPYADDVATLRTHMANLRRKIDPGGARRGLIRTESGVGYRFSA